MIYEILFRTELTICLERGSHLVVYKTNSTKIKLSDAGECIAVHRIMKCSKAGTLYRSRKLESIAYLYCISANDVMVKTATDRLMFWKSRPEISLWENMCGISESYVRNITDMALGIFFRIRKEGYKKIRNYINSYVLRIDVTTDQNMIW